MTKTQTVLVTGGSKGIGLVTTERFLRAGYQVIAVARHFDEDRLSHPSLNAIEYDLTDILGIADLISQLPSIDVLVNNAGVMHSLPYDAYPQNKVDEILKLNIEAPVALIREVTKSMTTHGKGRIVNNASIAGEIGHPDIWYGITKAGMINMTKSFARLLGPRGIIINAIAPGPVETDMLHVIPEQRKNAIKKTVFTSRFARPEEVAETIFWLATDCPEYINGTCIDINNGAFPR